MTVVQIPLRNDLDHYEFSIDLSGHTYLFEVMWNGRGGFWSLIIKQPDDTVLLGAIPLRVNADLFSFFVREDLPPGLLYLFDKSNSGTEPAKTDLGTRCVLLYDDEVPL